MHVYGGKENCECIKYLKIYIIFISTLLTNEILEIL